jgi:hypothetical protein
MMTDCKLIGAIIGMIWWLFAGVPRKPDKSRLKTRLKK